MSLKEHTVLAHVKVYWTRSSKQKCMMSGSLADWHASLNNKMGGDMKKIQTVGNYFVEVWKAVGMEGLNEKVHLRFEGKGCQRPVDD